jgi:hypothetical protein
MTYCTLYHLCGILYIFMKNSALQDFLNTLIAMLLEALYELYLLVFDLNLAILIIY